MLPSMAWAIWFLQVGYNGLSGLDVVPEMRQAASVSFGEGQQRKFSTASRQDIEWGGLDSAKETVEVDVGRLLGSVELRAEKVTPAPPPPPLPATAVR